MCISLYVGGRGSNLLSCRKTLLYQSSSEGSPFFLVVVANAASALESCGLFRCSFGDGLGDKGVDGLEMACIEMVLIE
jgi:hypothetical protein